MDRDSRDAGGASSLYQLRFVIAAPRYRAHSYAVCVGLPAEHFRIYPARGRLALLGFAAADGRFRPTAISGTTGFCLATALLYGPLITAKS